MNKYEAKLHLARAFSLIAYVWLCKRFNDDKRGYLGIGTGIGIVIFQIGKGGMWLPKKKLNIDFIFHRRSENMINEAKYIC